MRYRAASAKEPDVPDYRFILVDHADGICTVTLNRPKTLNSWNEDMRVEMRTVLRDIQADRAIRALVITGAGRAFSAGEDVGDIKLRQKAQTTSRDFRVIARNIHTFLNELEQIELPVIAAINGVAAAGGMELALSCDFRIAAASARVGFPEIKIGFIPGSGGCSRLVKAIGLARAKELVMTQRMLDAETALRYGLLTEVVPDEQLVSRTHAFARELCKSSPAALGMAKLVLQNCANTDLETSRVLERLGNSVMMDTPEHKEAVAAFLEKRPPQF
jgi:enoyl-CoA hydratase/carnithine racemase